MEKIGLGCDHAGFQLKEDVKQYLLSSGYRVEDFGTDSEDLPVDYPDVAKRLSKAIIEGKISRGILICGTGIGMSIAANKFPGIRASLCNDCIAASFSRSHNDANILTMGARIIGPVLAKEITRIWLNTSFAGERHIERIKKISEIEEEISGK